MKYYFFFGEGSKINQIIIAFLINLPVFAYGMSIGWISPITLILQSDQSPRGEKLTNFEISTIASVPYLVCIPADFFMAFLSDFIGRKKTLIFMSSMAVITWVIKLMSFQTWALIVARSFIGLVMAGAYVTCPLYTKDISEDSIRGALGSLVILFHVSGNLFSYVIGDLLNYRTVLWISLAIPAFHVIVFMMMPESPSYLIKHRKTEEAARVLAWLRCRKPEDCAVQKELNELLKQQKVDEESSKFALTAMLNDKILFRALRIAIAVVLAREACGAIPVLSFAGDIFQNASQGTNHVLTANQQAMMLGGVQVAGSVLGSSIVEMAGRRPLFVVTSLFSGLSMCVLASWFLARTYEIALPSWIPLVTLCVCIFCDSSGLQPVSVIICGDMFSFKYRGTVSAVSMSLASLFAFVQAMFFKQIAVKIGIYVSFYAFGFICLFAALYALLVIPETKTRGLEEIYEDLKTKKEKEQDRLKANKVENFEEKLESSVV